MKKFLKWFYSFSDNLFKTLVSMISALLFSRLKTNVFIRNIRNGISDPGECYILGNGPSLVEELKNEELFRFCQNVFAVNSFVTSESFLKIKPAHYFYIDPDLWRDNVQEKLIRDRNQILDRLVEVTKWKMFFYVPWDAYRNKAFKNKFINHEFIIVVPINITPVGGYTRIAHFLYNLNLGMPRPQNVLIASIFTSINLGFQNINVLGCDHSWLENIRVNDSNQLCIRDVHFYDSSSVKLIPWTKDRENNVYKLHEALKFFMDTFYSHHLVQRYAESCNTKVINLTQGSYIDAYPRGRLSSFN